MFKKGFIILLLLIVSTSAQAPEVPRDDNSIYFGLGYGAAGIINVLISTKTNSQISSLSTSFIDDAIENLWQLGVVNETNIWTKSTADRSYWTGLKYGQAGFAEVFVNYLATLEGTSRSLWIDRVNGIINLRMNQLRNLPSNVSWGYSFVNLTNSIGIPLSGLDFGASGLLSVLLDLYSSIGNNTYVQYAEEVAQRIINMRNESMPSYLSTAIPWYKLSGYVSQYVLGYSRGIAGIFPLFYQLAEYTGNQTYRVIADDQVNVLLNVQNKDGSWPISLDYADTTLGFDEGVSGIVYALANYADTSNSSISSAISNGINFLLAQWKIGEGFVDPLLGEVRNSLASGLAGIIYTLTKVDLSPSEQEVLFDAVDLFYDQFVTLTQGASDFSLFNRAEHDGIFDLSYKEGLAGALSTLLSLPPDLRHSNHSKLVSSVVSSFEILAENYVWPRQVEYAFYWSSTTFSEEVKQENFLPLVVAGVSIVVLIALVIKRSQALQ